MKVGDEFYFNMKGLILFFEKKSGLSLDFVNTLSDLHSKSLCDFSKDRVAFSGFVWKISKGNFYNNTHICIIAEQKTRDLSLYDIYHLMT